MKRTGGRDSRGPHHRPLHRRRPQAALPHRGLPAATSTDVPAKVAAIEYDPNRSARLALLHYADGEKRYILWPDGLTVGATVRGERRARTSCPATACP